MERGLIWLPLLAAFIGLAWAGWNEAQKLNACQTWAQPFDRYKYDIACVLAQGEERLIWGKPTRNGPVNLQELPLSEIRSVQLFIPDRIISPSEVSSLKTISEPLGLYLVTHDSEVVKIPFTDLELAAAWAERVQCLLTEIAAIQQS
jgi:hypothetical protein